MRMISELIEKLIDNADLYTKELHDLMYEAADTIEMLSEKAREPKQGEWIYPTDIIGFGRCNNCKALWDKSLIDNIYFKYCPRCGARMVKGADDED